MHFWYCQLHYFRNIQKACKSRAHGTNIVIGKLEDQRKQWQSFANHGEQIKMLTQHFIYLAVNKSDKPNCLPLNRPSRELSSVKNTINNQKI